MSDQKLKLEEHWERTEISTHPEIHIIYCTDHFRAFLVLDGRREPLRLSSGPTLASKLGPLVQGATVDPWRA